MFTADGDCRVRRVARGMWVASQGMERRVPNQRVAQAEGMSDLASQGQAFFCASRCLVRLPEEPQHNCEPDQANDRGFLGVSSQVQLRSLRTIVRNRSFQM